MTTVTVRRAAPGDTDAALRLLSDSGLPTLGVDAAWALFVTEDEAGLTGVAGLERHGAPPVYLLRSVAVRPERRGAGIGAVLVTAALAAADADAGGDATVGLLTETAPEYFGRYGFRAVPRDALPSALSASPELQSVCADTARAFLR